MAILSTMTMNSFSSLQRSFPLLYYILAFFGLHLHGVNSSGVPKVLTLNLIMFCCCSIYITSYCTHLTILMIRHKSYDSFLGNIKDALNMVYLLSVYFLTFWKRKVASRFLRNLSTFGFPSVRWWLKGIVFVTGITHTSFAFFLCVKVEKNFGKCILYTTATYTIPFLVDVQILLYIGCLIHSYRKVKLYLKTLVQSVSKWEETSMLQPEVFSRYPPFAHPSMYCPNILPGGFHSLKLTTLTYKQSCWYLIELNRLLNQVFI